MRLNQFVAAALAAALPYQAAAQDVIQGPTGNNPAPVAQTPAPTDQTAEEIAEDAARDLRDSSFYNRPGATRADYDRDWQACRLIARGSRTPSGTIPYYYNPAVISPLAAGIGAGLGGLLAGAIAEGQQRRANRRACLMIRGWRLIDVPRSQAARIREMTDAERSAYFDTIVGAVHIPGGSVTERRSFTLASDPAINLDAPVQVPGAVFLGRNVDPAVPLALAPEEGAIVLAFRRPDEGSAGRTGEVHFARYDLEARDLIYQPRDWRSRGDNTTYRLQVKSSDRRAPLEVHVIRVTPGDYVITGHVPGVVPMTTTFCFGGPTFHVGAGQVVYVGDFIPYMNHRLSTEERLTQVAYTAHLEDARRTLAARQPALAEALRQAAIRNRATFACAAINMDRWDIPGAALLPPPAPEAEPDATAAPVAAPATGTAG